MSRITFFDMDGVLADHVAGACEWTGKSLAELVTPGQWEIPAVSWAELPVVFWAQLKPTKEFPALVKVMLDARNAGEDVFLLTHACSDDCYTGKMMWIAAHLPDMLGRVHVTEYKYLLAAPDRVLYDDRDLHVDSWNTIGGTGILIPRLWNSGHTHLAVREAKS